MSYFYFIFFSLSLGKESFSRDHNAIPSAVKNEKLHVDDPYLNQTVFFSAFDKTCEETYNI